ncbi:LuxR C-terminal-related transcriptional regulator [Microbacterium sp. 18062]|uniref:ATP-binding protein n=1 Tax=Microbacterium sp. 18062 TaxID=2681410 RepID=UPI001358D5EA|nr:LuxR C-terminal-related transcriptional regulator [Microbacterium sp. 18062]
MIREPRSEFVGRRRELEAIAALLEDSSIVTLTGVGGAGKTRLALRAANERTARTGAASWFVALESVQDPQRLARAAVHTVAPADQSARQPLEVLVDALRGRPTLLVLDNCEHLVDAAAEFADRMLLALPELTILATSRRPLEVTGERMFSVPPLSVETGDSEAVELLVARARAADAGFVLGPDERESALSLCRSLDGLPLAIELAATRLRSLPVTELRALLSERFTLLDGGPRSSVERQRTLRAVVDWSHDLCGMRERHVWETLSVFSGPFDLDAAAAVAGLDRRGIGAAVDALVAQSILQVDHETRRFRMLETIRAYGRERASESGVGPLAARRHLAYFSALAGRLRGDWYGPRQAEIVARLSADRAELQSALTLAAAIDVDGALSLLEDLRYHWGVGGFISEGRAWAHRLLGLPGATPGRRLPALVTAAWLGLLQGDLDEADVQLARAERLLSAHALDDEAAAIARIEISRWRGTHAMFSGEPAGALPHFETSIRAAERVGRPEQALLAQFQHTTAMSHLRSPDAAHEAASALSYANAARDTWMRAHALWALALAAFVAGDLAEADARAREGIGVERGFDDPIGACLLFDVLSWIDAAAGRPERAATLHGAATASWRVIGSSAHAFGPHLAAHREACVALLVDRLGPRAFDRLTAAGAALSRAAAEEYALAPAATQTLSAREHDVVAGIHRGLSNRDIAEELVLSVRTVDTHVQRILAKLGVSSRAQVAVWAESTRSG